MLQVVLLVLRTMVLLSIARLMADMIAHTINEKPDSAEKPILRWVDRVAGAALSRTRPLQTAFSNRCRQGFAGPAGPMTRRQLQKTRLIIPLPWHLQTFT